MADELTLDDEMKKASEGIGEALQKQRAEAIAKKSAVPAEPEEKNELDSEEK